MQLRGYDLDAATSHSLIVYKCDVSHENCRTDAKNCRAFAWGIVIKWLSLILSSYAIRDKIHSTFIHAYSRWKHATQILKGAIEKVRGFYHVLLRISITCSNNKFSECHTYKVDEISKVWDYIYGAIWKPYLPIQVSFFPLFV